VTFANLVTERSVIVTVGSGGVGKTTTAAALAVAAAEAGRRACVVTIDPARRLADALGLDRIGNEPARIEGPWSGEVWAVMLDAKKTFDALVDAQAPTPEQAERIKANRFYRNVSGALSGTQEYMAAEKLYELHTSGRFDVVVVDTPPSRAALDFLDAPARLTRFLDHRLYRLLTMPTRGPLRAVNAAAQGFVRTLAKVVGAEAIDDAITFFKAFEGMDRGFRERADAVARLLTDQSTAYVLVASPRRDTVEEARFVAERLRDSGRNVPAVIINRMTPRFGLPLDDVVPSPLTHNLAELTKLADTEEAQLAPLFDVVGETVVVRVPLLSDDVHDLESLERVRSFIFAGVR
jgi:anion-transporting  ArsA/GET3 family ATPase